MVVHTRRDLEVMGRLARARFSHAFMSDTKWRKLFVAVDEAGLRPVRIKTKFIDDEKVIESGWPGTEAMYAPWPWIDSNEWSVTILRSIQWLLVPSIFYQSRGFRGVPPREVTQEIEPIRLFLASLGQFPAEISAEGLRIIGYK